MPSPYRIVITSPDGQTPRRLPKGVTLSARWSFQRFGGMWDAVITAAATLAQLTTIKLGDRVEIYVDGPGQLALPDGTPLPEWRGYITGRTRSKQNAETVILQAFGAIHFVRGFPANKNYATAYPADVATFFGALGNDFVQGVPGPGNVPLITTIDAAAIGITRSALNAEFAAVGAALDDLERGMGNLAGHGCDIDPHTGGNRLYLRANAPLDPPTHALPAPAKKLTQIGSEEDGQGVATVLQITGGQPDYPQLLHNGGFALPIRHTALSNNLLRNGDFEATTDWTLGGLSGQQAAYKNADFRGTYKHQPFSGAQQIELDHVGELAEQIRDVAFVAGRNYILAVRSSKGFGNQVADGHGLLEWRDANNAVIGVALTFPLTPASIAWDYFSLTAIAPAGAARCRAHFELDHIAQGTGNSNIGGLYLDAAELYDASQVSQDGMEAELQGGAVINAINWIYADAAYEGAYCLYLDVTAADDNNHDVPVQPAHAARFPVSPQQTIRFRYRYRSPNAGSGPLPRMQAELEFYAGDGRSTNASKVVVLAQPNNTNWQYAEAIATGHGDSVSARVSANLRGSGKILIDALSAMDAAAPSDPYQADGPFKVVVACNDADLLTAYPAGAATYGGRYGDYGPQVSPVTEESILTRADALAYADNFFRGSGPYKRPPLTLDGDMTRYYPGESLLLLGADGPALMDLALPIARVERSGADTLLTTLDIEREARDETQVINAMIDARLAKKGPGATGASGGGYSSQSNSGTGIASGATPAFRTTLQASPADPTLHDAYTAAPHASQASQDSWTAKEPGLGNPSANGQVLGSNTAGVRGWVDTSPGTAAPLWGLAGIDASPGGVAAFNPGDIAPTWSGWYTTPGGDLALSTANVPQTPIAYEQKVIFYTRLKVAAAKTIQITVTVDNACRVLLNGGQVGSDASGSVPQTYALPLNPGWNTLALCYQNGQGDSYVLTVAGVGGPLTTLVDRMSGYLPALPGPFGASGVGHAAGFVPDPGATAGSTRFLREDGGWQVPPAGSGSGGITLVTQLPVASASTRDVLYLLDGAGRTPDSLYVGVETAGSAYRLAKLPFSLLANGGFQPTSIAGCTLWLPADALTSYSGTVPVLKWLDLSGNGYDATAPSNQAGIYVATAQNGLSAIAFSGSQFYSSNAPSAMLPFTVFAVVKPSVVPTAGGANLAIFGSQAIGGMELRIDSNGMEALAEGRTSLGTEGTGAIAAGAWVLLAMTYDGSGNYAFYRGNVSNGTTPTKTGTNTAAISASTVAVGQNINNGGEGFQGQIGEMIQYSGVLSSTNFGQVVSYLKSKWAV